MKPSLTLLLFSILLSSCTHSYYIANVPITPSFNGKNELYLKGAYNISDEIESFDGQVGYSITNNWAVSSAFYFARGIDNIKNNNGFGQYLELSLGYFNELNENFYLETYFGLGKNNQLHRYSVNEQGRFKFNRYFVQPTFKLDLDIIEFIVGTRLSRLNFYYVEPQLNLGYYEQNNIDILRNSPVTYQFDNYIGGNIHYEQFRFDCRFGMSNYLTRRDVPFDKFNINIGIQVNLNLKS